MHLNSEYKTDIIDVEMAYPYILIGSKFSLDVYHIRSSEDQFDQ